MVQWDSTERLLLAVTHTSYLPLQKHPELRSHSHYFMDLYCGAEVYIFAMSRDKKWAFAYVCHRPLPEDFILSTHTIGAQLVDIKINLAIMPIKFLHIFWDRCVPISPSFRTPTEDEFTIADTDNETKLPKLYNILNKGTNDRQLDLKKNTKLPFPYDRLQNSSVQLEINVILSVLCSQIFTLYSLGDFIRFEECLKLYNQLDDIRCKLTYNLMYKMDNVYLMSRFNNLMANISKYFSVMKPIFQHGTQNNDEDMAMVNDVKGYEGVFGRDIETGILLNDKNTPLRKLISVSTLYGLTNNFPTLNPNINENFNNSRNDKNSTREKTNLLMDFSNFIYDSKLVKKFKWRRVQVCVQLRTADKYITEPYFINLNSLRHNFSHKNDNHFSMDTDSTVLFKNVPIFKSFNEKLYLVVSLVETVKVSFKNENIAASSFKEPYVWINDELNAKISQVRTIKRGIALGVTGISPIFQQLPKENQSTAEILSHKFKVRFYTGTLSDDRDYSGWGSIANDIIEDSLDYVVSTPKATLMEVRVKELKPNEPKNIPFINSLSDNSTVIYGQSDEKKIHLTIGKIILPSLQNKPNNIKNCTIKIISDNKNVKIRKDSNERDLTNAYDFISFKPGEFINETVYITGVNYFDKLYENLEILLYLNGFLMAKSKIPILQNGKFIKYFHGETIEFYSHNSTPIAELELTTKYFGTTFDTPSCLIEFEKLAHIDDDIDIEEYELDCRRVISAISNLHVDYLFNHFENILLNFINMLNVINKNVHQVSDDFIQVIQLALMNFIDRNAVSDDLNCKQEFEKVYRKYLHDKRGVLPNISSILIRAHGYNVENTKNPLDFTNFSDFIYTAMLCAICSPKDDVETKRIFQDYISRACSFLVSEDPTTLPGIIVILEDYKEWIEIIPNIMSDNDTLQLLNSELANLHEKEAFMNLFDKQLNDVEKKYLNTIFEAMVYFVTHPLVFDNIFKVKELQDWQASFLCRFIVRAFEGYKVVNHNPHYGFQIIRLANKMLMTICENAADERILKNIVRTIPEFCRCFINFRNSNKANGFFKPKRTFIKLFTGDLFPSTYPIDSVVNNEIICEELLEMSTIFCQVNKIAIDLYGENVSILDIIDECRDDTVFTSDIFAREIGKADILALTKTIEIFFKGEYYSLRKNLSALSLFAKSSLMSLYLFNEYLVSKCVPENSLNGKSPELEVWVEYLKSLLSIANHKITILVRLAIIPRKAVFANTGDLKKKAAELLDKSWGTLVYGNTDRDLEHQFGVKPGSDTQLNLILNYPFLFKEIITLAFHKHVDATKVSCKITWNVFVHYISTFKEAITFSNIGISQFYNSFKKGDLYLDDDDVAKYIKIMMYTVHLRPDDPSFNIIVRAFELVFNFLELIVETCKIPNEREFDDDRVARHIAMFGYLLNANRPELFHKLINDIYMQAIRNRDYVKAALSLELLASTYTWNPVDELPAIEYPSLPAQSSFERKEYLSKEAAKNFSKGLKLEKALSVYKELISAYDDINYDLSGLAFAYKQISQIYTKLQKIDRIFPTYFKVLFLGLGFPATIRNKAFIYEGLPFEHISAMHNRLLKIHHGSTIINSAQQVKELLVQPKLGKYINVVTVEPKFQVIAGSHAKENSMLDNRVRLYIENRDLKTFSHSLRLPGFTSVTDLWVKEYTYITETTFPTLLYRSAISEVSSKKISPLENAKKSLHMKIQELAGLKNACLETMKNQESTSEIFNELSRNITGTISAPVNGGISQYKAFFETPICNEIDEKELHKLSQLFYELAELLSHCLLLHRKISPNEQNSELEEVLLELFRENFAVEIREKHIVVDNLYLDDYYNIQTKQVDASEKENVDPRGNRNPFQSLSPQTKISEFIPRSSFTSDRL